MATAETTEDKNFVKTELTEEQLRKIADFLTSRVQDSDWLDDNLSVCLYELGFLKREMSTGSWIVMKKEFSEQIKERIEVKTTVEIKEKSWADIAPLSYR